MNASIEMPNNRKSKNNNNNQICLRTAHHFGRYEPTSPSAKEFHALTFVM